MRLASCLTETETGVRGGKRKYVRRLKTAGKSMAVKDYIPQEIVEEVRGSSNILELVSQFVTLKRTGKNYVGICPFHTEKSPSFTVNADKQIYYCFGCGEGGNEISFLMKIQNISFPEAVRKLAVGRGIHIPERKPTADEKKLISERSGLLRIHSLANRFFKENFHSSRGKPARDYLDGRGISEGAVRTFSLGYAPPGWRNLKDNLAAAGVPEQLLRKSGLVVFKEDGRSYDRFRERLIFPIESVAGDIVGFGGRLIGQGEPKYLNSPESPLYTKGDHLYGLYLTRDDIRDRGFAVMVEGYFDVLSLWNAGITNVIATLGTALTKRQVSLLGRYTRKVVLLYDSDEGGRGAVERCIPLFLNANIEAVVAELPEGSDPDDFVREYGKEKVEYLVSRATPLVDYYIERIMKDSELVGGRVQLARETISFIKNISDVIQRNIFIKRCSERLGLDQKTIKDEVNREPARRGPVPDSRGSGIEHDPVELYLLHLMLEFPERIPIVSEAGILNYCADPILAGIARRAVDLYEKNKRVGLADIIDECSESAVRKRLSELALGEAPDGKIVEKIFLDTIKKIKTRWYRERHRDLRRRLMEAREKGDRKLCDVLLEEKTRLIAREKQETTYTGDGHRES